MRVERQCVIDADRDTVWKVVSNPDCYPDFIASLERWETVTEGPMRKGARYTVHWKIGSVPIGGVVEVTEFDPAHDLAWIGVPVSRCAVGSGSATTATATPRSSSGWHTNRRATCSA
jgi:uncharacterized protein YndB with AHSA1/START domain